MTLIPSQEIVQIAIYVLVLLALTPPLGAYMARVYNGDQFLLTRWFGFAERGFYRLLRTSPEEEQDWKGYAVSVLVFSLLFIIPLYVLLRVQSHLPLNPDHLSNVTPGVAVNTAISFVTNTNWQYYGGEYTMSYLSQMAGLAVQNFVSAGVGLAVLAAMIRGFARHETDRLGNFWVDLYRSIVYILLPLSIIVAVILISQGVPQTFAGHAVAHTVQGGTQDIARGPVASQIAIKQLGTNGGGFYNSNSAVPFENPTGLTNFVEMLSILLIASAEVYMFGKMIRATRQAWAILAVMFLLMIVGVAIAAPAEQHGSPVLRKADVSLAASSGSPGGNMEGKEVRFGIANTALWADVTTDASNGSVTGSHDSMTAFGGAVPLTNMFIGEVIFGGVGSGLYGMLMLVIIAVFVGGLMVGRTPEYLGKKIEAREMKLAVIGSVWVPIVVLVLTAVAMATAAGKESIFNAGPHGFTEAFYAYTSQGNNNGSAFAGYGATNLSTFLGGLDM
ncbi:MAG TPA: potassium-transporting ATPase subunit KdpA, partial [Gaiellales bacterium]|nr:potassium-transporting ATPase subunit KdpA [Gaiellales bacterium]